MRTTLTKSCPRFDNIKKYNYSDAHSSFIIADVNGDKIEDIILLSYWEQHIKILLNFGNVDLI